MAEKRTRLTGTSAYVSGRVRADELAFAVEVGRDDNGIRLLREVLDRLDDAALGGILVDRREHELRKRFEVPSLEVRALPALREVDLADVALEPDADPILPIAAEAVHRCRIYLVSLHGTDSHYLGDAARGDVLLGNDKTH
jgi:hypothetical protein